MLKSISPWTITGLTDGDGSFYITVSRSTNNKTGLSELLLINLPNYTPHP
jgi:hypothetical protein